MKGILQFISGVRHLKQTPDKIALIFAAFSLALLFLSGWQLENSPKDSNWTFFWTAATGTATSALAAALLTIFAAMREIWKVKLSRHAFLDLIGANHPNMKVKIVLPRFPASLLEDLVNTAQQLDPTQDILAKLEIQDRYGCTRSLMKSDKEFVAAADLKAATEIFGCFDALNLPRPEVVFADIVADQIKDDRNTVFIVVGLISNTVTMMLNAFDSRDRLFAIKAANSGRLSELALKPVGGGKLDHQFREALFYTDGYLDEEKLEPYHYALISKVKRPNGCIAFILGGLQTYGTTAIAQFFCQHWTNFADERDRTRPRLEVRSNGFAATVKITPSRSDFTDLRVEDN